MNAALFMRTGPTKAVIELAYDNHRVEEMSWPCEYFSYYTMAGGRQYYFIEERGSYRGPYGFVNVKRVLTVLRS